MKKIIAENASFQGYFTEVCFDTFKRKPAVVFSKWHFFQNSLVKKLITPL
jgi:hypothetical protein